MKNHTGINAALIITLIHTLHIALAQNDNGNPSRSNDAKCEGGKIQVSRKEMTGFSPFDSYSDKYAPTKITKSYWASKDWDKKEDSERVSAEVGFQVCKKIKATKLVFKTRYFTNTNLLRLYGLNCFSMMGKKNGDNTKPACKKEYIEVTKWKPHSGGLSFHHEFYITKPKFFQAYGVEFPLKSLTSEVTSGYHSRETGRKFATMRNLQVTKMNCTAPSSAENASLDLFTIGLMKCEKHFEAVRPSYP